MRKSRSRRAFGLTLLMLTCTMAVAATNAGAGWTENGSEITSNKKVEVSVHTEGNLEIPQETNLEILCAKAEGNDLLLIKGTSQAAGGILFSNCKTWQNGANISANCKPTEPIQADIKVLLLLDSGKVYGLFEPITAGSKIAVVKFKSPCALPESNNIKGSLVVECLNSSLGAQSCSEETKVHLLRGGNQALFPTDELMYGTKPIRLTWFDILSIVLTPGFTFGGTI